jgi:hypothetical protein
MKYLLLGIICLIVFAALPINHLLMPTVNAQGNCNSLKNRLNSLKKERESINKQLESSSLTPKEMTELRRELKSVNQQIAVTQKQVTSCQNPPPPPLAKPDLVATNIVQTIRNGPNSTRSYKGVVTNNSDVPANGPFEIVLGVSHSGGTVQITDLVPAGTTIQPHQQFITKELGSVPNRLNDTYVAEMQVNLERKLLESNTSNNTLSKTFH